MDVRGIGFLAVLSWALPGPAPAQTVDEPRPETIIVTGDRAGLIATGDDDAAFGFAKPLTETPRAVTIVSDTTIDRYGIGGVDTLTAIVPSAYTASYYGVEGAVNLRGTLAETYFQGFKRAENRGTYATPLSDAAQLEIVRGPPSAIYGAGKVGGLVNVIPKSEAADAETGGEIAATYGSYSKRNLAGAIGTPLDLGAAQGGVHAYGEIDDSYSFYRGLHPSHQLLELSGTLAAGPWSLTTDYMFEHANGDVQTPGWNRLTQSLIDTGRYVTGSDTSLKVNPGATTLGLNNLGGNPYAYDPNFKPLYLGLPYCGTCTDAAHSLDVGVGTTNLSSRTVDIAPGVDFSNTVTHTGFIEVARALEGGTLRLQGFVDTLENDRFVSYGFPASYRTLIGELRARYDAQRTWLNGRLTGTGVAGASYRYVHGIGKESYNSGVIALDRRDITQAIMPNEIIASPFRPVVAGVQPLGWENDVRSTTGDAGAFLTGDLAWDKRLDLTIGGRYDAYNVRAVDLGVLPYEPAAGKAGKGSLTYSASLSWHSDWGLDPYVTNAKAAAVEIGQASQVMTSLLQADDWLSASYLNEAGVKFAFLESHLVGALDWYGQQRTQLQQGAGGVSVMGTRAKGGELEIRYVVDDNISLTFAGSLQHNIIKGPDHSFTYVPARLAGVSPQNGFGGAYVVYDFSTLRPGNYENTLVPHAVLSPWALYTADAQGWGVWGAGFGATYVSQTAQTVPDPIVFPDYVTFNASAFVTTGPWQASVNVTNLSNARYFTPDADTYSNLGALPGIGRQWRVTLKRRF